MSVTKIERERWQSYFDSLSRTMNGSEIDADIITKEYGCQIGCRSLPLYGISYDPISDVLEFACRSVDHMIPHPKAVYIDETDSRLQYIDVVTNDGTEQIVQLKPPLPVVH
jgi:hypothetical protein